ncbi:MAG TPA: PASTA domain-containing protein [Treponemataceae bacterium]|nr:PASTA domain-containing protein [Treponemataceae bacterium]
MKLNLPDFRPDFELIRETLDHHSRIIVTTALIVFILTAAGCIGAFFLTIKSGEKVMVPAVAGKDLTVALLEMQAKELYPKIQLKYSSSADDRGIILEQSPAPGSIVKAGRRINLVVSRGIIIDRVENYIGQNVDDVKIHMQTLFTSMTTPLLSIKEPPLYRFSEETAGTVLEQKPLPDTPISEPIQLELVVSRGPENDKVRIPDIAGLTIAETLAVMEKTEAIFDFSTRSPEGSENAGTIVAQMPAGGSTVNSFSRVSAVLALPVESPDGKVYGVFSETLPVYPYPFQITIDAVSPAGQRTKLVSFKHPGGNLTVPYRVDDGTLLVLTILNKEVSTREIRMPD